MFQLVMLLFSLRTDLFLLIPNSFYEGTILSEQLSLFTFFILLYQWYILVDSWTLYFQLLAFPEHINTELHSLDSVNLFCQTSQRELKGKNIILLHAFSTIFIIIFFFHNQRCWQVPWNTHQKELQPLHRVTEAICMSHEGSTQQSYLQRAIWGPWKKLHGTFERH